MRVGAFLPTYWTDYGTTTVREAVEEAARAAEALGYASVWANDHVIAPAHQAGQRERDLRGRAPAHPLVVAEQRLDPQECRLIEAARAASSTASRTVVVP